jgi:hypothetical protein
VNYHWSGGEIGGEGDDFKGNGIREKKMLSREKGNKLDQ